MIQIALGTPKEIDLVRLKKKKLKEGQDHKWDKNLHLTGAPVKSMYAPSKWLNSKSTSAARLPWFQTSAHMAQMCNVNIQYENNVI